MHAYASVPRYTQTFYAETRDFICPVEMTEARARDALELETHKAWRRILDVHSHIRSAIGDLRIAWRYADKGRIEKMTDESTGITTYNGMWTQKDVDDCLGRIAYFLTRKAEAWQNLRFAEAAS